MLTFERTLQVSWGTKKWKAKVCTVGAVDCVRLPSHDASLARLVAAMAKIDMASLKMQHPRLEYVPGFIELRRLRNMAQATSLSQPVAADVQSTKKKRKLFADDEESGRKRRLPKHSRTDAQHLRENPTMIQVDVGRTGINMQRPVQDTDEIVIEGDNESIQAALEFIADAGMEVYELLSKRDYRQSGTLGVWKVGKKYYNKDDVGKLRGKKRLSCAKEVEDSDADEEAAGDGSADEHAQASHHDDDAAVAEASDNHDEKSDDDAAVAEASENPDKTFESDNEGCMSEGMGPSESSATPA